MILALSSSTGPRGHHRIEGVRQSGAGPSVDAPREAGQPPRVSALALVEQRQRERAAARRKRLRRRIFGVALLAAVSYFVITYAVWMLQPTSVAFGPRSVEWVRADVPFGNWIVDNIEQAYYSAGAPKKGGPQLKNLPAPGGGLAAIARAHASA
jgi:hypothetical protein